MNNEWSRDSAQTVCDATDQFLQLVIAVRQTLANLQVSMIQLNTSSLRWVSDSATFWQGPNAEKFRQSASSYVKGALDVPRRQVKQLPSGVARDYVSRVIKDFKEYENDISNAREDFDAAARKLFEIKDDLAVARSKLAGMEADANAAEFARLQNRDSPPSSSFLPSGPNFGVLSANVESLEFQEQSAEGNLDQKYQSLKTTWKRLRKLRTNTKDSFEKCFKELERQGSHFNALLETLKFRNLTQAGISLENWGDLIRPLVDGPKQVNFDLQQEQEFFLSELAIAGLLVVPRAAQDAKHFTDVGKLFYKLNETGNFKAFGFAVSFISFAIETGTDIMENNWEEALWIDYVKKTLALPNGIFEQFFRKGIEDAFRANLISEIFWNAIKAAFIGASAMLGALVGGAVGSVVAGVVASQLLEEIDPNVHEQMKLERGLEDAVARGFYSWHDAQQEGSDPLLYQLKTPKDPNLYAPWSL